MVHLEKISTLINTFEEKLAKCGLTVLNIQDQNYIPVLSKIPSEYYDLLYYQEYWKNQTLTNYSIIIIDKKEFAINLPLILIEQDGETKLTFNGSSLIDLENVYCFPKTSQWNYFLKEYSSLVITLIKEGHCTLNIIPNSYSLLEQEISRGLIHNSFKYRIIHYQTIDLSEDLDTIFSNFRSSYKNLINKFSSKLNIKLHRKIDKDNWNKFKLLHFKESGNVSTRSDKTWEIQMERLQIGQAILLEIKDSFNNQSIGFAYFTFSKSESLYAVAAYDRSKFDLPLGHLIQWEAIKYLKKINVNKHILGQLLSTDQKKLAISKFKMGFGNTETLIQIYN